MRLASTEKSQSFQQIAFLPKPAEPAPALASKATASALRADAFETNPAVRTRSASTVDAFAASAATVHTVRAGESLTSIAQRYGTTVQAIAQANGITNPDRIYVGQQLHIPGTAAPTPTTPAPGPTLHTVRAGETLSSIAQRYGTTVQAISQANGITNPDRIQVGQQLRIPTGSTPTTPAPTPVGTGVATNVQDANRVFLNQWGPTAYNSGGHPYGFNDCGPTSGAMVLAQLGLTTPASASQASGAIDRVRDAVLGYDSTQSTRMTTSQLAGGLRALGANTQLLSGPVVSAVDGALSRGNPVILGGYGVWGAWGADQRASGNYLNGRDPGGHFVAVLGKTQDGKYLVGDPLVSGGAIAVTAEQLQRFYGSNGFGILEVSKP